ncbi:fimbrial protein [Achromobacter pestifer]
MKKNQLARLIASIALGTACTAVLANDKPGGTVRFEGSIVEAPCSISSESLNQTVPMDQVSSAELKGGKKSTPKSFKIDLVGCDLEDAKKSVTATFTTSTPSDAYTGLVAIQGGARGASLGIADGRGEVIKMGDESSAVQINSTTPSLQFQAFLQGEQAEGEGGAGKQDVTIVPGAFYASVNFMLNYK